MKNRLGDINKINNKNRKFGSSDMYYHVRVQFSNGEEKFLLLTENQVVTGIIRADKNPEDEIKASFVSDLLD